MQTAASEAKMAEPKEAEPLSELTGPEMLRRFKLWHQGRWDEGFLLQTLSSVAVYPRSQLSSSRLAYRRNLESLGKGKASSDLLVLADQHKLTVVLSWPVSELRQPELEIFPNHPPVVWRYLNARLQTSALWYWPRE